MSILIDIVILALLAGVLAYAWLVDRRVRHLVRVLHEMAPMVDEFSAAVDKSENSIFQMKAMTQSIEDRFRRTGRDANPFRSRREDDRKPAEPELPAGVTKLTDKAELVRNFFDTVKSRQA